MPEGASPEYGCFAHGEMVGTVSVWFYVAYNSVTGYYPSFYDNSSYKNDAELTAKYGVPACGAAPVTPSTAPPSTSTSTSPPSAPASQPKPTCYGDYCSGKSATKTNCAVGAVTLASLGGGPGNGKLELVWSARCKTKWAQMVVPPGWWNPGELWAQQSTGYSQSTGVGGNDYRHTTDVASPMIYSPKKCVAAWYVPAPGWSWNAEHTSCR